MTTYTQTYCDICDRDAVGTWMGVCADCWQESLEPGAPNADMARVEETIPDDPEAACASCGERAEVRTCHVCGVSARLIDCGHYWQPRPIAAGRANGMDGGHDYCQACAQIEES